MENEDNERKNGTGLAEREHLFWILILTLSETLFSFIEIFIKLQSIFLYCNLWVGICIHLQIFVRSGNYSKSVTKFSNFKTVANQSELKKSYLCEFSAIFIIIDDGKCDRNPKICRNNER